GRGGGVGDRRAAIADAGRNRAGAAEPRGAHQDAGRHDRSARGGAAHGSHRRRSGSARRAGTARRPAAPGSRGGGRVIRTNLSTKPFYNERSVQTLLLIVAVIVVAATSFNASRVLRYSRSDTQLATQSSRDEARAADLRKQAAQLRASVDVKQVDFASADAKQANDLIDRRTFSWTDIFNRFEGTLPDEVRIVSVKPRPERSQSIILIIAVVARGVDDVNQFIANLEETGAFTKLRPTEERVNERGEFESVLEA